MKYNPHSYQQFCIDRMINAEANGFFIPPGGGKTSICLTAFNELKFNRYRVEKLLVISTKKIAESTWHKEAAKWDHLQHLRFSRALGSEKQRIRALNTPADVYTINRENIPWLVSYYCNAWPFDLVVIDESTSIKNPHGKRFKAMTWVRPHITRMVELTGTPQPRSLFDLWSQVYLLDGGKRIGKSFDGFRGRYFDKIPSYSGFSSYEPKAGAKEAIWRAIGDICFSMDEKDIAGMPELVPHPIYVQLDAKAERDYKRMEKEMLLQVDMATITAGTAAVLTGKLLQIAGGAAYDADKNPIWIHDCKIEALLELIEELDGQPALLLYNFRHELERLKEALSKTGLRVRELKTPEDEDAWNRGEIDILLAHPQSSGHGLNLQQGGNHVIWYSLPNWNLEYFIQAYKRLCRPGQSHPQVFMHILIALGTMDEEVMRVLDERGVDQTSMLNALRIRIEKIKGEKA